MPTLAVTPLRVVFGVPTLARFRRMLGLFACLLGGVLHALELRRFRHGLVLADVLKDVGDARSSWSV